MLFESLMSDRPTGQAKYNQIDLDVCFNDRNT